MLRNLALAAALLLAIIGVARTAPYPSIANDVGVCDPNSPLHCLAPDASGNLPAIPPVFTPSAPSGALTLTTGGAAQNLFAAGEVVHGCWIQNPPNATETISVNFFTTAAAAQSGGTTSVSLSANQTVPCGAGLTTAVSWIAATTGHAINAGKF